MTSEEKRNELIGRITNSFLSPCDLKVLAGACRILAAVGAVADAALTPQEAETVETYYATQRAAA